ncbi:MAG TPA: glycosyltransferase, partial [Pirellulales bacterium]|nr:glycosyltransferase [Pirellulales bacterium]
LPLATASGTRQCAGNSSDLPTPTHDDGDLLPGGLRLPLATTRQIAHEAMAEEYYRRISAHCLASYSEGAPLTVAEALACGRPVISTNVGIVPQLVQHGVNGLIVPREAAALAAAMAELKRLRPETMAVAARRSAMLFDWSRQAPKWAHCFRSALDLSRRRTHARIAQRPEYAAGEWQVKRFGTG